MYDHQIKRYSIKEQQAVYWWFIISSITIPILVIVLGLSIIFQSQDKPIAPVSRERDIKELEDKIKQARDVKDIIEQIQSKNHQQLNILKQIALCIPDHVCLHEAKINATHLCLKGDAYSYNALFAYQKALEIHGTTSLVLKSLDKQQDLITFVLETN